MALRRKIRYVIFQWVSRGLFVAHKLIFLSLITFRLMQKKVVEVEFEQPDMDFLLNAIPKTGEPNPIDEWLPNNNWNLV